jgi:hypothetical protein
MNKMKRKTSGTVLGVLLGAIGLTYLANKKPRSEVEASPETKAEPKPSKRKKLKVVEGGKAANS